VRHAQGKQNRNIHSLYIIVSVQTFLLLCSLAYIIFINIGIVEDSPMDNVKSNLKPQREVGNWDYSNSGNVFVISDELGMSIPKAIGNLSIVSGVVVKFNGSYFLINLRQENVGGLCGWEEFGKTCNYDDESMPNIETVRIWKKDKSKVFAINPQGIWVNGHSLNQFIITKFSPTEYFTNDELTFWNAALTNIISF